MPFDIYGQPLRRGYCEAHPDCRGAFGECDECVADYYDPQCDIQRPEMEPEYSEADVCAAQGHPYYGDDSDVIFGGRCFCGERRYPKALKSAPPSSR